MYLFTFNLSYLINAFQMYVSCIRHYHQFKVLCNYFTFNFMTYLTIFPPICQTRRVHRHSKNPFKLQHTGMAEQNILLAV